MRLWHVVTEVSVSVSKLRRVVGVVFMTQGSGYASLNPSSDLMGVPAVVRVAQRMNASAALDEVLVATDSPEKTAVLRSWGFQTVPVMGAGSFEKAVEVAQKFPHATLIVTADSDEPLLEPREVNGLVEEALHTEAVTTLVSPTDSHRDNTEEHSWVALDEEMHVLNFWRGSPNPPSWAACPVRSAKVREHVNIYAYRPEVFEQLAKSAPGPKERLSGLEQYRALENGLPIRGTMCKSARPRRGGRSEEDVTRVRSLLASSSCNRFVV